MKKSLLGLAVVAATLPSITLAEAPTVYGKVNVSLVSADENKAQSVKVNSNASRIGIKGKKDLDDGITAIYQAEYQTNVDESNNGKDNASPFKQRNIFGGLKGGFGTVKVGYFDTAVKKIAKKIDLFNDLEGDIKKVISNSEQRGENTVQYSTPKMAGLTATVAYLAAEQEDGKGDGVAASLVYKRDAIYAAYAYGKNASAPIASEQNTEVHRVTAHYKISSVSIGAMYESQKDEAGWLLSAAFKATDKLKVKAQYGSSTIVKYAKTKDASALNLGVDYKLAKKAKVYAFVTQNDFDDETKDATYIGTGVEVKF